jgi:hypothetical protein
MTEPCFERLAKLESLETLWLSLRTNGHAVEISHIPSLTSLSLNVGDAEEQEQNVAISNLPLLPELWLIFAVKKINLVLTDMPELRSMTLILDEVHSVQAQFENLPKVTSCKWRQGGRGITKAGVEQLRDEPFRFTQNLLEATLNLPALHSLDLPGPVEENVDLRKLAALPELKNLTLNALNVSIPDLCSHLKLSRLEIWLACLPDDFRLENMPTLESLSMYYCVGKNITLKNAPHLKRFYYESAKLQGMEPMGIDWMVLQECPELTQFGCAIDWSKLRLLDVRGTKISKTGLLSRNREFNNGDTKILVD